MASTRTSAHSFGHEQQFARLLGYEMAAFTLESPLPGLGHDRFITMTGPQRQVTVYPIRGGRMATFFLHACDRANGHGVSSQGPYETLHRVYGDLNWVVPHLIEQCPMAPSLLFDVVQQIQMPRWSHGRVALVGDACGVSLGWRGKEGRWRWQEPTCSPRNCIAPAPPEYRLRLAGTNSDYACH